MNKTVSLISTIAATSLILSVLVACGANSRHTQSSSLDVTQTHEMHPEISKQLTGKSDNLEATLTSEVDLANPLATSKDGWLVLAFNATSDGTGWLTLATTYGSFQDSANLNLHQGAAAIVINPERNIMKVGPISGKLSYVCGPQGMRCEKDIPPLTNQDLTYPCGPQGALCHIDLPVKPDAV